MVGKTQGACAATYAYRFGDKLKAVTSNFPGETASVGYNYDGLGRRRLEQRDNTTATWFRWSGSEECGEYAGTVGSWTIGALQTGYVPGLATFAGSNPATAEWRYHLTDHLGSVRQLTGQTKAALARYDYAPYGELLRSAGLPSPSAIPVTIDSTLPREVIRWPTRLSGLDFLKGPLKQGVVCLK